ncbi:hypothetical protein [Helicobacter sp. T3_23-1056]
MLPRCTKKQKPHKNITPQQLATHTIIPLFFARTILPHTPPHSITRTRPHTKTPRTKTRAKF